MRLAGLDDSSSIKDCADSLGAEAPPDYRELASVLAQAWSRSRPRWVGLAGGQGAGKSTLGRLLERACSHFGLRACVLGIDDFYLTKQERRELAGDVHPLFETRGPPGTHDLALCRETMEKLTGSGSVKLPVFDKGLDDRTGSRSLEGPFDLVVLEGWCVGAQPVPVRELVQPINELERQEDPKGIWRRAVNEFLGDVYAPLWLALDQVVFLEVPDLSAVRRWRLQQEQEIPPEYRLDALAVDRFVSHYERVTLGMLKELGQRADWTVRLAPDHSVAGVQRPVDSGNGGESLDERRER
jgi:D-glycerate 3-kinase